MNKKVTILIVSIIGFLVAIGGLTYAYIRSTKVQNDDNSFSTINCLNMALENKDRLGNATTGINLTNLYPVPDAEGLLQTPYTFTITNLCNTPIAVEINLETQSTSTLDRTHVKFNISDGTNNYTSLLSDQVAGTLVTTGNTTNRLDKVYLEGNSAVNPATDTPSAGSSKTYDLRLWVNEATTFEEGAGKEYHGKITVVETPNTGNYTPEFTANSGTLLYAIKNGNYTFGSPLTTPGREISSISENLIAGTTDDYGTSYYFRGNVKNNYVLFANKCWRIVRIDGNGNIKLVFENNANNCLSQSNAASRTFNGTAGVYDNNTGMGFMYGVPNSNNLYDPATGEHANLHDSIILDYLKTWYDNTFDITNTTNYTNLLADVIWCNDKTLAYYTSGSGLGKVGNRTEYGARSRIVDDLAPSLICPTSVTKIGGLNVGTTYDIGSLSKFTAQKDTDENNVGGNGMLKTVDGNTTKYYKVGLLTADEVTFAGAYRWTDNKNYYLFNNTTWWTMSPDYFEPSYGYSVVWGVISSGALDGSHILTGVQKSAGVRPSISLIPSVTLTNTPGQDGTKEHPYVIDVPETNQS